VFIVFAPNLSNIIVAYDDKGKDKITDFKVHKQKNNTIIISPESCYGWAPTKTHYVLIEQKLKNTSNKKLIFKFTGLLYEMKTISGKLKLPNEETAFEDVYASIDVFSTNNGLYTKEVIIPKGKNSVNYSLKVPVNLEGYSLRYNLVK